MPRSTHTLDPADICNAHQPTRRPASCPGPSAAKRLQSSHNLPSSCCTHSATHIQIAVLIKPKVTHGILMPLLTGDCVLHACTRYLMPDAPSHQTPVMADNIDKLSATLSDAAHMAGMDPRPAKTVDLSDNIHSIKDLENAKATSEDSTKSSTPQPKQPSATQNLKMKRSAVLADMICLHATHAPECTCK